MPERESSESRRCLYSSESQGTCAETLQTSSCRWQPSNLHYLGCQCRTHFAVYFGIVFVQQLADAPPSPGSAAQACPRSSPTPAASCCWCCNRRSPEAVSGNRLGHVLRGVLWSAVLGTAFFLFLSRRPSKGKERKKERKERKRCRAPHSKGRRHPGPAFSLKPPESAGWRGREGLAGPLPLSIVVRRSLHRMGLNRGGQGRARRHHHEKHHLSGQRAAAGRKSPTAANPAMPDPATATDEQWADYVFNRRGEPGVKRKWWYHVPSGTWFLADRDNRSDAFLRHLPLRRDAFPMNERLPPRPGEWIDRSRPIEFRFEGHRLHRLCRRRPALGPVGQRRASPRPQLQVSPAARSLQSRRSRRQRHR